MRKILILLFSVLAFYACDSIFTDRLILINDTEQPIYYLLDTDTVPYRGSLLRLLYPYDTAKPCFNMRGPRSYERWENHIKQNCIDSAAHIFIFQTDKITDEMIETTRRNQEHVIYIGRGEKPKAEEVVNLTEELIKNREYERLSFKVKELDSLNWTVVYSGKNKTKEGAR